MRKSTLFKVASQSILKNKMRTLLTMLGIVIGVGSWLGHRPDLAAASVGGRVNVRAPGTAAERERCPQARSRAGEWIDDQITGPGEMLDQFFEHVLTLLPGMERLVVTILRRLD